MVIYNYKDSRGIVHIESYGSAKKGEHIPEMLCGLALLMERTQEFPTCEQCVGHIKYAVIIAKNSEFPTDTN